MESCRVVIQKDLLAFSKEVNKLIQDGWQLVGGVSITEDRTHPGVTEPGNNEEDQNRFIFKQAMSKTGHQHIN